MEEPARPSRLRVTVAALSIVLLAAASLTLIDDSKVGRAAAVASIVLVLWVTEVAPLYATTMILWALCALVLGPSDPKNFSLPRVLSAAASPVMPLFFGGFALSSAATRYGIDAWIASGLVRLSRGRRALLLLSVMAGTATLSMWMSNIAAAAMMVATLRPLLQTDGPDDAVSRSFRKALLLGVAFAADFGGIGTPVGTGPNLIAIGAVEDKTRITFLQWMLFGVPIAVGMLVITFALLCAMHHVRGTIRETRGFATAKLTRRGWSVVVIFSLAVVGWTTEPLHGVSAAIVALGVASALFATRLLDRTQLAQIEWDTLLLVAGGLTLGHLFEASGLAHAMAAAVNWQVMPPAVLLGALVLGSAFLSALASNTAAAAMLITIGLGIRAESSTAVLIALAASMGVPFVISTPPNSMVYNKGGLEARDLFVPGIILMCLGCVGLALAGPTLLKWVGLP